MSLGEKVRQLREAKGVSQKALEEEAKLSKGVVSKIETGKQDSPSIAVIRALSAAFDVTPNYLLEAGSTEGTPAKACPLLRQRPGEPQRLCMQERCEWWVMIKHPQRNTLIGCAIPLFLWNWFAQSGVGKDPLNEGERRELEFLRSQKEIYKRVILAVEGMEPTSGE